MMRTVMLGLLALAPQVRGSLLPVAPLSLPAHRSAAARSGRRGQRHKPSFAAILAQVAGGLRV